MSNVASPKPKRRKNKAKLKLSWDEPTKEERIAKQIDDFISDVIESAKQEYLIKEHPSSINGECEIYLNEELKEEMIKLDSMETAAHVYDDSMENCGKTRQAQSEMEQRHQDENCPARHYRASELNEGNPLLAEHAHMPKRRYLRFLQRHLMRMCCQCTCFMNGNDVT